MNKSNTPSEKDIDWLVYLVGFTMVSVFGLVLFSSSLAHANCIPLQSEWSSPENQPSEPEVESSGSTSDGSGEETGSPPPTEPNRGSGSGGSQQVFIVQGEAIRGFQGLPWGATPDMVREKIGQPTYGKWQNYSAGIKELTETRNWTLPEEIDAIMGWGEYREGKITVDGSLWTGFTQKDGRYRLVWIYKIWDNLGESQYNYISDHQFKNLKQHFGDPQIKNKKISGYEAHYFDHDPMIMPFINGYYPIYSEWEGHFGNAIYNVSSDEDYQTYVGVSFQSKLLNNGRAKFPPEGQLSNLDLGSDLSNDTRSETYGKKVESTEEDRLDGFRDLGWGSSPDQLINSSQLGEPMARNGRELAKKQDLNLPAEGTTVWTYEEEILGSKTQVWVAFDTYHQMDQPGLIWAATTWDRLNQKDYRRVRDEITSLLRDKYDDPAQSDRNQKETDSKLGYAPNSKSMVWSDNYGKLFRHLDSERGSVVVHYQSQALVEKRAAEVQDAESKF